MSTAARPLLHHRADGPDGAPVLLLGPSLGTSLAVWDAHVAALAGAFRVVRWDLPGHGGSAAGLVGAGATVADLGHLVLDLADALGARRFRYAGISLGGAVGAWLAAHHPERVQGLALVCSSARFGTPEQWRERAALVRAEGTEAVAATAPQRWFTAPYVAASAAGDAPAVAALTDDLRAADPAAYAACCDALAGFDLRPALGRITAPTLVVAGRDDPATPPGDARELADGIPGATLLELPGAAHLAAVERPQPVRAALRAHFGAATGADDPAAATTTTRTTTATTAGAGRDDEDRRAAGMAVRRAVLGDAHVDRAVDRTTPLTAGFQDFITRYAWGEIWTRPGLDRRTRTFITLTALVAGGHLDELAMHVRAALRNGLTREEVGEVLLQTAVYCGVPAANSAFAVAQRVLDTGDSGDAEHTGHADADV